MKQADDLLVLYTSFANSGLGKTLAGRVRYERYKPEATTNEQWVRLLGEDVGNLTHLKYTYELAQKFTRELRTAQPDMLDDRGEQLLLVAALIHDWAEAITGDITYSDKTAADDELEKTHLTTILGRAAPEIERLKPLVIEAAERIVFDHNNPRGFMFNTIERLGYMTTALRAAHHVQANTAGECRDGFTWIVADVFGNHPAELIERSQKYAPVRGFLKTNTAEISAAFAMVPDTIFERYPKEQRAEKRHVFAEGKARWESFIALGVA